MSITGYHAKYLAHELTRRCGSDSVEKLASVLADAQVDLCIHFFTIAMKRLLLRIARTSFTRSIVFG
jgi:hypothetical protein